MVLQTRVSPPDWTDDAGGGLDAARCLNFDIFRDVDGIVRNDAWFQQAEDALSVCNGEFMDSPCPLRQSCLYMALVNNDQHGVYGGMTVPQRRWIRRNVPKHLWNDDKHLRAEVPAPDYFEDYGDEDPDYEEERDRAPDDEGQAPE